MKKKLSIYIFWVSMILSFASISCDKEVRDECICIFVNRAGEPIGNQKISPEVYASQIFLMLPNPTSDVVGFIFKTAGLNTVTITDKRGKVLFNQSFEHEHIMIDVNIYIAGEYRVTVDNGNQKNTQCLIKKEWYWGGMLYAQKVGSVTAYRKGGAFSLKNDVEFLVDGEDRWRTNAFELTIGDFSFGNYINTNFGRLVSEAIFGKGDRAIDTDAEAPIYGKHPHEGKGAWKAGEVFSSPAWIGYRVGGQISRVGYSHRFFQNLFQNGIHTTRFGSQNYYLLYTNFNKGSYGYSGYYNPFSLWGY